MPITIHNHVIDKLAILVGFSSGLALYPQLYLILQARSFEGVSILSFAIIFINSIVWLAYSIHRGLFSLGISSILNMIASGSIVIYTLSLALS